MEKTSRKQVERNKQGQVISGTPNPNGRPLGRKNFKTLYYEAIERIAQSQGITGEEFEVKMIEQAARKGFNGDRGFYTDTMDRVHGKAEQKTDITSDGESIVDKQFTDKQKAKLLGLLDDN